MHPIGIPPRSAAAGFTVLADGLGDWGLMAVPSDSTVVWLVCGAIRAEAVEIDATKVKVPRCRILYAGHFGGAMQMITPAMSSRTLERSRGAASATGDLGAASATGSHSVAVAAGFKSRGMVSKGCLLVLVERDDDGAITGHFAAMAGTEGIEPGKWYTLTGGNVVEVGVHD